MRFFSGDCVYVGTLAGRSMTGGAASSKASWTWQVFQQNAGDLVFAADVLRSTDPYDRVRKQSYSKARTVRLPAGQTLTIDLTSTAFDTYLRVEDEDGNEVAADDDGGEGLNSRVTLTPPRAGNYRLIATSFRGGATGAFQLRVSPGAQESLAAPSRPRLPAVPAPLDKLLPLPGE
ncbi:MAG: PPC domain-containing protein [Gemmataceae bacterium]|nr:PPC domain-containing protein [Gemmataceae bacterium]